MAFYHIMTDNHSCWNDSVTSREVKPTPVVHTKHSGACMVLAAITGPSIVGLMPLFGLII